MHKSFSGQFVINNPLQISGTPDNASEYSSEFLPIANTEQLPILPEFDDVQITTLKDATAGGIIPDAEATWLGATAKSILSYLQKLVSKVYAINSRVAMLENRVIADITLSIQSHVVDINSLDINEGEKISISITGKGCPSTTIMIRINDLQSGYYSGASAATYITCFSGNNFFINLINLSLNNAMLIAEVFFARSNDSVTTSGIAVFGTNPSIIERITKISIIGYSSYDLPVGTRIIIKKL